MKRFVLLASVAFVLLSLGACIDPCDRLSDRICECKGTATARETCRQQVAIQKENFDPDDANKAACEAALETCTCDALDQGELSKCGFSR